MNETPTSDVPAKRGLIRRIYDWTISWADKPGGAWALFLIAFVESSFFPIPPDVLLMALVFGSREKWLRYAAICTAGSVLGGVAGWAIGWGLADSVAKPLLGFFDPSGEVQILIQDWYRQYGFWGILIAAITPIPYKVFTIASGLFHYSLPMLVVASVLGRGFRFFAVAAVIRVFGPRIRPHLERNLELWSIAFGVLIILGLVAVKFLKHG